MIVVMKVMIVVLGENTKSEVHGIRMNSSTLHLVSKVVPTSVIELR